MSTKYFGGMDLSQIGTLTASFIISIGLLTAGSLLVQGTATFNSGTYWTISGGSTSTYEVIQDSDEFLRLRRSGGLDNNYSILVVDAPTSSSREATISLRSSSTFEIVDVFNQSYPTAGGYGAGFRIQKRATGVLKPFAIEYSDGVNPIETALYVSSTTSTGNPHYIGIGNTNPIELLHVSDGNILAKSVGTTFFESDRGSTSAFGGIQFKTNGTEHFDIGGRNDATENIHFFNADTGTSTAKVILSNNSWSFNTSTFINTGGYIQRDLSNGSCYALRTSGGVVTSTQVTCPSF